MIKHKGREIKFLYPRDLGALSPLFFEGCI